MSGNAIPQFTAKANISGVDVTAANTKSDGSGTIGTDIFLAFTADATNGSFVEYVRLMSTATVAATTTTATVARIFASSASAGATTSANTHLLAEVTLPSVSADHSTNPINPVDVPLNLRLPAGWTILVTNHAAPAASTKQHATVIAADY